MQKKCGKTNSAYCLFCLYLLVRTDEPQPLLFNATAYLMTLPDRYSESLDHTVVLLAVEGSTTIILP